VTFTKIIHSLVYDFLLREDINYLDRLQIDESFENYNWSVIKKNL